MSKSYTVVSGDRLTRISQRFYGIPEKYPLIIQSNPILGERQIKGILAADGLPIIYPGQILIIPDETIVIVNQIEKREPSESIDTEFENALIVIIDNLSFQFFSSYTIISNIGSLDTISIASPYFDTPEYRNTFQPLHYKSAAIYYGKDLFFNGILIAPNSQIEPQSETMNLNFYPKCGILQDCPLPISYYPIELNNLNLKQIAETVASVFSIKVEFIGDPGASFEKVGLSPTEKPLNFLIGLAKKRGFLITNNINGDLLIWKAEISNPVAFVKEGELPFISCTPSFDPQNYYSSITGLTPETEEKEADSYTWENPFLSGISRPLTIEINDIENGDLKSAVEAAAGRMFAQNKYPLVLNTHRDENNNFFQKNTMIRSLAPKSNIYNETDFLIEKAILTRTIQGDTAQINQILPGAYTGELPEVVPWEP
jgi:LysM repeat protein